MDQEQNSFQLHLISNGKQSVQQLAQTMIQIHPWMDVIHIREKEKTALEVYSLVQQCIENGVPKHKISINDRVDVAAVCGLRAHLAYHSLPIAVVKERFPQMIVGKSVHSLEEASNAVHQGADYVMYGHIFASTSKPDLAPRGVKELQMVSQSVAVPVIAIGGISPYNTNDCIQAGAAGIAVMSGIWEASQPREVAQQLHQAIKKALD